MQWIGRRESENVDDRRGMSGGKKIAAGGGIIGIIIVLLQLFGGENAQMLTPILEQMNNNQTEQVSSEPLSAADDQMGKFVRVCLADNEDVWTAIFKQNGMEYEKPVLVLFRGSVATACGGASAASGPFYCPGDHKLYMDMSFFDDLKNRFGAKGGDFAISYVISHEVGHHVQNLLGTADKIRQQQNGLSEFEANKLSVVLELQADFYAGIVAHNQQKLMHNNEKVLDARDIEDALSAANAIGDDAIQSKMQGQVIPDSFTHGTSKQRVFWFTKGYTTGDIRQGNTFDAL